jgi:UDP-3-O-[3-hydroxymyristoyl] glucosamine N-acyltransferase
MYLGKSGVGEGVIVGGTVAVGGGELVVSAAAVWATVVVGRGVNVGWALDVGEEATVGDTVCGCMTLSSAVLALLLQAANSNSSVENSSILDSALKVNGAIG